MTTHKMLDEQDVTLPGEEDVGRVAEWLLPSGVETIRTHAQLLGVSTSYQPQHYDHPGQWATFDERCRACRWFEPRILREVDGRRRYLVHRTGRSAVPGEVTLTGHEWVHTPHEVVEVLTTRKRDQRTGDRTPYLTQPAARVLAQAAAYDDDLHRAYVNRAVA